MTSLDHPFKCTVAALLIAVGFSLPGQASAQVETLDELFAALADAPEDEARRIENRIVSQWEKSGSAAMDLLLQRGSDALEAGELDAAAEHFSAAIDHSPDFAEAYHGRATAYFLLDYYGPALDDLRQTLVLEPRHFGALRGFAIILETIGQDQEALEVYRRIMDIHPHLEQARPSMERLEEKLRGQTL